jgi:hypothetical protein
LGKLGSWALPSETISIVSAVALLVLFALISATELTRFFFRLSYTTLWLSVPAAAISLYIARVGSYRPGPILPRIWSAALSTLNVLLCLVGAYVLLVGDRAPVSLREPYPLHPLALSGLVGAIVLLPRLYPMHPLKAWVQTIAPACLGVILCVSIPLVVLFLQSKSASERQTVLKMGDAIRQIVPRLRVAAEYAYSDTVLLRNPRPFRDRTEAALSVLREDPQALQLPDETRWSAVGVLERDRQLKPGELERLSDDLIDVVHDLLVATQIPEIRSGRYIPYGASLERYMLSDDDSKRRNEPLPFGPGASIASVYFPGASAWYNHIKPLSLNQTEAHYNARMADIDDRLDHLSGKTATLWWVPLMKPRVTAAVRPKLDLSTVFETPLGPAKPMADLQFWTTTNWGGAMKIVRSGACRLVRSKASNPRPIEASADSLTQFQRESGRKFFSGAQYDWDGTVQCFAYHAPIDETAAPLVIELRLTFQEKDLTANAASPCETTCWTLRAATDATPKTVELFADIPPSRAGQSGYPSEVTQAYSNSAERLNGSAVQPVAPPGAVEQSPNQKVVRIRLK